MRAISSMESVQVILDLARDDVDGFAAAKIENVMLRPTQISTVEPKLLQVE